MNNYPRLIMCGIFYLKLPVYTVCARIAKCTCEMHKINDLSYLSVGNEYFQTMVELGFNHEFQEFAVLNLYTSTVDVLFFAGTYFRSQLSPNQFVGIKMCTTSTGCDIY